MPRAVWEPVVKQEVEEEKAHDTSFANVIWTAADGLEAFEADEEDDNDSINLIIIIWALWQELVSQADGQLLHWMYRLWV